MAGAVDVTIDTTRHSTQRAIMWPKAMGPVALLALGISLVFCFILSIGWGAIAIPPLKVAAILLDAIGLPTGAEITLRDQSVVLAIRLPRALLGLAVGGGLAIAGAAMQGLFRNP
ncbi:MAG: iron chelate uptake ABC transporter family permease subunit, partial [Pseudomonadota bacterium]